MKITNVKVGDVLCFDLARASRDYASEGIILTIVVSVHKSNEYGTEAMGLILRDDRRSFGYIKNTIGKWNFTFDTEGCVDGWVKV